jgi:exosortase/archaeosortase family protein
MDKQKNRQTYLPNEFHLWAKKSETGFIFQTNSKMLHGKLIAALCLALLVWSLALSKFPGTYERWMNNALIPQSGWWVLAFAIISTFKRRSLILSQNPNNHPFIFLVGISIMIGLSFWGWESAYLVHLVWLFATSLLIFGMGGRSFLYVVIFSLIILMLLPGLPKGVENVFLLKLQNMATSFTCGFCKLVLSEDYVCLGYEIFLPGHKNLAGAGPIATLVIAQECTGFRSLFGMVLLALLFISNPRMPSMKKLILLIIAMSLAIVFNMVRLAITTVLYHYGFKESLVGMWHSLLGNFAIGMAALLLYFIYRLFLQKRQMNKTISALKG